MLINLSEVMSVKDKVKHMDVPNELDNFQVNGESYPFSKKDMVALDFYCTEEKKVQMKCETKVVLRIPCSRCLEEVEFPIDILVNRELDFSEKTEEQDKEDEMNYIHGYNIDVDAFIFQEILISFPTKVLCSTECNGVCPVCGCNLNKESCQCHLKGKDPRMSVIQDIFKNFTQTDK